jgi:hypothetical protein
VIDIFVIFRPIATRNDDVCTRLYPIRLKKYIAIAHVSKLEFGFWKSELFLKNKTAAFAFNQRIDTIDYSLSYVI